MLVRGSNGQKASGDGAALVQKCWKGRNSLKI